MCSCQNKKKTIKRKTLLHVSPHNNYLLHVYLNLYATEFWKKLEQITIHERIQGTSCIMDLPTPLSNIVVIIF